MKKILILLSIIFVIISCSNNIYDGNGVITGVYTSPISKYNYQYIVDDPYSGTYIFYSNSLYKRGDVLIITRY